MTRLALLADIHGNLPALEAVIADMQPFQVDQVVVAGDTVNWGPFSRAALAAVMERGWAIIRGNNALYALDWETPRMPAHWRSFTLPAYLREQLGDAGMSTLACLPDTLSLRFPDAPSLRIAHGIPGDHWTAIFPGSADDEVRAWLGDIVEDTVVAAHSHIPMHRCVDRWQIFNPGSVGVPLDGDKRGGYMVIDGDNAGWRLVAHRRVAYDDAPLFAQFERDGFVERCGITASLVIEEFRQARLQVLPYINWKAERHPDAPESDALLAEFLSLDDWRPYMPRAYRDLDGSTIGLVRYCFSD